MDTVGIASCRVEISPVRNMRNTLLLALILLAVSNAEVVSSETDGAKYTESKVVTLTDENFDELVKHGEWLVEIYAPWCIHCKALEPIWEQLAAKALERGVQVGKIDGVHEKVLLARFRVEGFPSIFHVKGGETREYKGSRSLQSLEDFAYGGWRRQEPLAFWRSPTSTAGRLLGAALSVPGLVQTTYQHLKHDLGYSELTILAGALAVPLSIGVISICALDAFYTRNPDFGVPAPHPHQE
uniref:Thioredoxin-like protein n=1 Tax=Tetraselmis sp. GSL018 TaxID=582737 RepID=A0A061QZL4_9CHLO|mmetsp:Transcript_826/g.1990  ORF Transcript_826/g.1990 Transcript_826/m.1990 type:complete len:241 (-) Transcript_826:158-880(-)